MLDGDRRQDWKTFEYLLLMLWFLFFIIMDHMSGWLNGYKENVDMKQLIEFVRCERNFERECRNCFRLTFPLEKFPSIQHLAKLKITSILPWIHVNNHWNRRIFWWWFKTELFSNNCKSILVNFLCKICIKNLILLDKFSRLLSKVLFGL